MRKITSVILAAAALSLVSCSSKPEIINIPEVVEELPTEPVFKE